MINSIALKLVKQEFLNLVTLHVHLCSFQITHGVKQFKISQRTDYYDLNCFGQEAYASQNSFYQNTAKLLIHKYFLQVKMT